MLAGKSDNTAQATEGKMSPEGSCEKSVDTTMASVTHTMLELTLLLIGQVKS